MLRSIRVLVSVSALIGFALDMFLQITNRVSSVQFVSATAGSNGGMDIVASVLDASGAPVPGRPLSCWVRSTCGLVQDMVPGWTDTWEWITMANRLNVGPDGVSKPTASLFLPSYCSGAGYPSYVRILAHCSVAAMRTSFSCVYRRCLTSINP